MKTNMLYLTHSCDISANDKGRGEITSYISDEKNCTYCNSSQNHPRHALRG